MGAPDEPNSMTDLVRPDWHRLESFSFGDSPTLADELAALVLAGIKTATCWAVGDGASTHVGKRMVVLSGSGCPLAVIETVELTQRSFNGVDAVFAYDEGEAGILARGSSAIFHAPWSVL